MSELKRCPFCGETRHVHKEWINPKEPEPCEVEELYELAWCEICGVTVMQDWNNWNTRPIEDALQAENERLKEELQHEKTRSQLNLEAEERRMLNITYYCAEIDRLNARIARLEEKLAELVEVGNKMRDLIEQDYDGYLDETIDWRGMAEEADDVLQEREE
jgi:vacuolar-type H+-ATPase subunit I/STV1